MQMSTLDSYHYSYNKIVLCIWAWERCRPSLWKWLQKKNEKEKKVLNWCSIFHWQKARSNARPPSQRLQNADEKQDCQYWILRLVVFTRFRANRDWFLKLYTLVKSPRTVSRELYWEKTCLHWAYFIWLAEGVATILGCCAKLVFMLLTIGLWHRAGLLKLWVAAPNGVAKCHFGSRNQVTWQIRYNNFCKICKKIEGRPAVNLFLLHFSF